MMGFEGIHGGHGFGNCNPEGVRLLDFAAANEFVIGNSFFKKQESHTITYESVDNKSVIDHILFGKKNLKQDSNIKVIPCEEAVP